MKLEVCLCEISPECHNKLHSFLGFFIQYVVTRKLLRELFDFLNWHVFLYI